MKIQNKIYVIVPVVLLVYKRVDATKVMFKALNKVKIQQLYIVADGPKNAGEIESCAKVIEYIKKNHKAKNIYFNIAPTNMGLRNRIITGLNWVFSKVDRAIILEDDCIPDLSFFPYAAELLERYQDNQQVMSIAGFTSLTGISKDSYTFSRFVESWGWATWRRAWSLFDLELTNWPELRHTTWLAQYLNSSWAARYWKFVFDNAYYFHSNSWAYRWMYTAFKHHGYTIFPSVNLISNIGFDEHATHTKIHVDLPKAIEIQFPLMHPGSVEFNNEYDRAYNHKLLKSPITILGLLKSHWLSKLGLKS